MSWTTGFRLFAWVDLDAALGLDHQGERDRADSGGLVSRFRCAGDGDLTGDTRWRRVWSGR